MSIAQQIASSVRAHPLFRCTCGETLCSDDPELACQAEERGLCGECWSEECRREAAEIDAALSATGEVIDWPSRRVFVVSVIEVVL